MTPLITLPTWLPEVFIVVALCAISFTAGCYITWLNHDAQRVDRHYQEQSYWIARDKCEQAWRHLRWLSSHPRLAYRVFRRAERITARREAVG